MKRLPKSGGWRLTDKYMMKNPANILGPHLKKSCLTCRYCIKILGDTRTQIYHHS